VFNIVLIHPEIPQNTGNIGRLCVSADTRLHIIRPTGFSLEDSYVKRAGLDYWEHLDLRVYDRWDDFSGANPEAEMYFFSTKTDRVYWDCPYRDGSFLIFGNEGAGLPEGFYSAYREKLYTIPMAGKFHRSLNLANSVAITLYEGIRKRTFKL
jgi:tRNA (cytidine/uridine-2'-O-)-methyltransferase